MPWAWGVNGAASVLGSVGAIALAMLWGFDQALLVAAGLYLAGLGFVTRAVPDEPDARLMSAPLAACCSGRWRRRGSPLAAVVVLALAGELWLRLQRREAVQASERFRATNVFFANGMELNAGNHSLWQERWQEYLPGAKLDVTVGGERFVVEMNSEGYRTHEFAIPKPARHGAGHLHRRLHDGGRAHQRRDLPRAAAEEAARALPGAAARGAEPRRELGHDRSTGTRGCRASSATSRT